MPTYEFSLSVSAAAIESMEPVASVGDRELQPTPPTLAEQDGIDPVEVTAPEPTYEKALDPSDTSEGVAE